MHHIFQLWIMFWSWNNFLKTFSCRMYALWTRTPVHEKEFISFYHKSSHNINFYCECWFIEFIYASGEKWGFYIDMDRMNKHVTEFLNILTWYNLFESTDIWYIICPIKMISIWLIRSRMIMVYSYSPVNLLSLVLSWEQDKCTFVLLRREQCIANHDK
jgi:hypothetical protein